MRLEIHRRRRCQNQTQQEGTLRQSRLNNPERKRILEATHEARSDQANAARREAPQVNEETHQTSTDRPFPFFVFGALENYLNTSHEHR